MKKTKTLLLAAFCAALIVGTLGFAELATAQATETVTVHIGTGTILHRSGETLIIDVKEGQNGPGIRKFNIKSTDGIHFKDRLGNMIEVFDLKKGEQVSAYRTETRPAPVKISMSEAEEIMKAEPPAAPRPAPKPAPKPAPMPAPAAKPAELPSTGSQLPLILLLGLSSLGLGLALRLARSRG